MQQTISKFDILGQVIGQDMQKFVDNIVANRYNVVTWKQFFKRGNMDISDNFTVLESSKGLIPMASVIDANSPKPKRSVQGVNLWQGKIPMLGSAFDLTADDLRQYYILLKHGGEFNDKQLLDIFYNNLNKLEFGVHARLNSMAMMAVSTAHIILDSTNNPDGGVIIDLDMKVPASNKKYAGFGNGVSATWSDPTATPLTDLQDMLDYADDNNKPYDVFYMHKSLWRTFIRHPNVEKAVRGYIGNTTLTGDVSIPQLKKYMSELGFPPIIILDEKTGLETNGIVASYTSYDESNVVLARAGTLGEVKFAEPITIKADPAARYATTEDGRITLLQTFDAKRKVQSFESECLGLPVLTDPSNLIIFDSSKTTSWI